MTEGGMAQGGTADDHDVVFEIETGIAELFRSARLAIRRYSSLVHVDLQPTGFTILRQIAQCESIQASGIVQASGLDKSAVSRQVRVLRDLGLVDTSPDPHDGRSSYLVVTPLARERLAAVRQAVHEDYTERFVTWSADELAAFATLLHRFNLPTA